MSSHDSTPVQRYYDNNTKLLLALGQGHEGTIHRAVWGPGIRTRDDALAYVDELVGARVQQLQQASPSASHVVDLACGVAAPYVALQSKPLSVALGLRLAHGNMKLPSDGSRPQAWATG